VDDKIDEWIARFMAHKKLSFSLLAIFIIAVTIFTVYREEINGKVNINKHYYERLAKVSQDINEVWKRGDYKQLMQQGISCEEEFGDLFDIIKSDLYFRCNPSFLNCYLRNFSKLHQSTKVFFQELPRHNNPREKSFYQLISKTNFISKELPAFTIKIQATASEENTKSVEIYLEDSCNDTYLPKRIYAIAPYDENKVHLEWKWDNFDEHIFIDKNYVTFRDIKDWVDFDHFFSDFKIKNSIPAEAALLAAPATGLSIEQAKRYCHFRGKKLLQSRVLDAASFHPVALRKTKRSVIFRGPFPWSYERKNSQIYKYWHDQIPFDQKLCAKIFTKECFIKDRFPFPIEVSASWIGIFNVLGGYAEILDNKLSYAKNIHPSGMNFSLKKRLHQIGIRGEWNEKELDDTSFNIPGIKEGFSEMKLAFRCMRVIK